MSYAAVGWVYSSNERNTKAPGNLQQRDKCTHSSLRSSYTVAVQRLACFLLLLKNKDFPAGNKISFTVLALEAACLAAADSSAERDFISFL